MAKKIWKKLKILQLSPLEDLNILLEIIQQFSLLISIVQNLTFKLELIFWEKIPVWYFVEGITLIYYFSIFSLLSVVIFNEKINYIPKSPVDWGYKVHTLVRCDHR